MDDRDMLERRLAHTEHRLSELEHHVAQQRDVIASLEAAGRGGSETAEIARTLLQTMELNVRRETTHRTLLRGQLRR